MQITTTNDMAAVKELKEAFGLDAAVHEGHGDTPGVLAMLVLFTVIFSAALIVWGREFGFLHEMLVAPVSRSAIVIGRCLG